MNTHKMKLDLVEVGHFNSLKKAASLGTRLCTALKLHKVKSNLPFYLQSFYGPKHRL